MLLKNTEDAVLSGACGLPWMAATNASGDTKCFWGFDHLGQIMTFLAVGKLQSAHLWWLVLSLCASQNVLDRINDSRFNIMAQTYALVLLSRLHIQNHSCSAFFCEIRNFVGTVLSCLRSKSCVVVGEAGTTATCEARLTSEWAKWPLWPLSDCSTSRMCHWPYEDHGEITSKRCKYELNTVVKHCKLHWKRITKILLLYYWKAVPTRIK